MTCGAYVLKYGEFQFFPFSQFNLRSVPMDLII